MMRHLLTYFVFIGLASTQELLSNQRCNPAADRGECQNFAVKWHYDRYSHRCRQFYYGGCGGNENRFETQQECESQCRFVDNSVFERCSQPYEAGHCHSDISRHYFDMQKGACICANYTGCGGNNNMFYSFDQCMSVCGQFAKPNHIQIHDNTPEYTHGSSQHQTVQQQHPQHGHHIQPRVLQPPQNHHRQQQQDAEYLRQLQQHQLQLQQRQQEEERRRQHPVLSRGHDIHSLQADEPYDEDLGHMKIKKEETEESKSEFSIGTTHVIRHGPDGSKFVTKINGHPMVITEKIMEMVRSGRANSIDDAINQLSTSNQNLHLTATSQPVPNYVYMNERQPLKPVYRNVPQTTVTKKVTSSSLYQNLPREAFIRPVDPEERRKWKERMTKKIKHQPVRRIEPSASTYYEVLTTPEPAPATTTRATTTTTTTTTMEPETVPETTITAPAVPTPTTPSSFYQETFDLSKIRKHKEKVRNGKIPPQRPMDDYEDDRVPYEIDSESQLSTVAPTVPPTAPPTVPPTVPTTTTRATVVLPVSREDLPPTAHTLKVLPSLIYPTAAHFDLAEGKEEEEEEEEYDEYESDGLDDVENELTIQQKVVTTTTVLPPTTTVRPRPTVPLPAVTVAPTFASRSRDAMVKPLRLVPPSPSGFVHDQTTSTTTTPRPTEVTPSAVRTTKKSLFGSYESEEFDIRPARGSIY